MADDWIKMRGALLEHPKLIAMSRVLGDDDAFLVWMFGDAALRDRCAIVARSLRYVTCAALLRVWSCARAHGDFVGDDLILEHISVTDLDEMAGAPGVGAAMESVGWAVAENGVTLPNFREYNVPKTAAERQKAVRDRQKRVSQRVAQTSRSARNENAKNVAPRGRGRERELRAPASAGDPLTASQPAKPRKAKPDPDALKHRKHFFDGWERRWREVYQRDPPKIAKGHAIAGTEIVKVLGDDPAQIDRVLDAYFADTDDFFTGHPITKLKSQLERFIAKAGDHGKRSKPSAVPGIYGDQGWGQ